MTSVQEPSTLSGVHDTAGVSTVDRLVELRWFTTDQVRAQGYDVAYCPVCGCTKSGHVEWTNQRDEGCTRWRCRCHHDHDEQCNGTLEFSDERLCGFD